MINVYDIANQRCPLLGTRRLKVSDVDVCTSICLCNVLPEGGSHISKRSHGANDFRGRLTLTLTINGCVYAVILMITGNQSSPFLQEIIVMGMTSGDLVFLDTLADLDVICTFQVICCSLRSPPPLFFSQGYLFTIFFSGL